jgi:hypothetical protein
MARVGERSVVILPMTAVRAIGATEPTAANHRVEEDAGKRASHPERLGVTRTDLHVALAHSLRVASLRHQLRWPESFTRKGGESARSDAQSVDQRDRCL